MTSRSTRNGPSRSGALIHRGPQAATASHGPAGYGSPLHAPNAALLIDFDNVTMGIRSDLGNELRTLLSSDIIKGKVAVQRAYADWRRYPQYVVPLAESSIDMIWAPAYGSSKKNATDIRLAVDAIELVFTRPEIGTFILLSGDSDFASLVLKLKEYGKYVIGVGIRESSSDLLVMNCDEYYSYNALAGLVKNSDEEPTKKWDPWELVTEAVTRMKRNGDVMRSDRLKQVMQEIETTFDEKDLGMAKFSRFVQEAVQRGLLSATKLENGQLEIDLPSGGQGEARASEAAAAEVARADGAAGEPRREGRGRRGRRGRGGRDRGERAAEPAVAGPLVPGEGAEKVAPETGDDAAAADLPAAPSTNGRERHPRGARGPRGSAPAAAAPEPVGLSGERLTRDEAFDLIRRAVEALAPGEEAVRAATVRARVRSLLGRDSESLSDRNFPRILKDAHDADVIDLRRRGDDFEVARASEAPPATESLAGSSTGGAAPATTPPVPRGMGPRGVSGLRGRGGRAGAPPPELLSLGVVKPAGVAPAATRASESASSPAPADGGAAEAPAPADAPRGGSKPAPRGRAGRARKTATKKSVRGTATRAAPSAADAEESSTTRARRPAAKKPRARKTASRGTP